MRTSGAFYSYRPDHQEWSASVLKAMLMVSYLDRPIVAGRALSVYDNSLLYPMITRSDNGLDLTGQKMFLLEDAMAPPPRVVRTKRVGVDYSGEWKDALLRFFRNERS